MAKAQNGKKNADIQENATQDANLEILSTKKEVAAELKMSESTLSKLLQQYPFMDGADVEPKIRGRWRVTRADVHRWFLYVQRQECRHPESRRLRPEEPPCIADIRAR